MVDQNKGYFILLKIDQGLYYVISWLKSICNSLLIGKQWLLVASSMFIKLIILSQLWGWDKSNQLSITSIKDSIVNLTCHLIWSFNSCLTKKKVFVSKSSRICLSR